MAALFVEANLETTWMFSSRRVDMDIHIMEFDTAIKIWIRNIIYWSEEFP